MKKHRVSEKSTSKTFRKRLRILAGILCVCVLFATYSDLLMTFSVLAADTSEQAKVQYVSAFAELSREVREQTVPVGTELEALLLPDTLEAVLWQPEGGLLSEDTSENEKTSVNEHENTEIADTMPTAQEPADTEQNSSDTATGANGTDDAAQTDAENVQDAEQNMDTKSVQDAADIEQAADESAETAPLEQQENTEMIRKMHVVAMTEYNAEHVIDVQTLAPADTQNAQQQEQTVRISGITWQSVPAYDKHTRGGYIFTAVLPEGFLLAEGVSLPQITVTVENDGIRALRDRIAALPDAEEYLAQEPDTEEMQAYAQWEETLRARAREALAVWEEYAALTEEQKAQITEEELAKLTAWTELAESLTESSQVMAADDAQHTHCVCVGNTDIGDHTSHTDTAYDKILASNDSGQLLINGTVQADYILASGNYYLAEDAAFDSELIIAENSTVYICLNGHVLRHDATEGCVICVGKGSTFTLCDCDNSKKGCIREGKGHTDTDGRFRGGAIYMYSKATFNMFGGVIIQNEAENGGGAIYSKGNADEFCTVNIYGGEIINNSTKGQGGGILTLRTHIKIFGGNIEENTAGTQGGGIYVDGDIIISDASIINNKANQLGGGICSYTNAVLSISGAVDISGNTGKNGTTDNVFVRNNLLLDVIGSLEGSSIGVTTQSEPVNPIKIAEGGTNPASGDEYTITSADWNCFFSDNINYEVLRDEENNQLLLGLPKEDDTPHIHDGTTYTKLTADNTALTGGTYYLSKNLEMGTITTTGDVTVCLNGHTLKHLGDTGSVIVVNSGTFTLCDCENDTGCITGGKGELDGNSLYGGGIYVCKGARLIMRGGTIRGNTAKYGGGISIGVGNNNAGTYFTMSGGVIEDNTADSQGGGIFCGGIGEMTITNGVIRNNTANSRGAGIFAGTAATVNLLANGETDKVSICGNKVVESNGNGGGYTDFQKAILKIEGNVNITGNKRDQDENNIALLNGRVILLTDKLTGSFGVTTWNAPYSENNTDVNNPYKTTVQGADGYEVSSSDLARISSDDTRYSVLMIEGNIVDAANGETGKVLVLGNKDTGNLSGMDLSIKDGSSGEEIKLSPDFAETTYEYTVTVPNSVRAVSIVATPKNAGADVAMTIQNADNATDTEVEEDNIPLAEGKNTIKVNVTEGGASKVYIITIIREASAGNTVTVTTRKDGAEWAKPSTDYRLTNDNGATFITDLRAVPDGTYRIYDGDTDTNVDVTVNGKAVTAYVDYYIVTFYDGSTKLTDPAQQTVRKGDAASKPADGSNPAKTGYTFTAWVTADGGSTAYDFAAAVMEKTAVYAGWTDNIAPVLGTLQYSYAPKRLLQWLIGKEDLTITVPVTEEGSGADEITCTITPTGAAARKETAAIQNGKAQMTVSKDFKGTIAITCTDKAGNTSKDVTVDVLLEDHAPQIAVEADHAELLPTGEYRTAPSLTVTVTDNKDNAISSGIASVCYQLGSGSEKTIDGGYTKAIVETDRFTIASDEIPAGETLLTITATDHAGNSVTVRQTIKVHAHSGTLVAAAEATCTEDGMKAHYTCACGTWFWDSGCTQEIAEQSDVVIGALGHAFGEEYLFDETDHWRQCARCKEVEPKENHIFDNDADMTCNKCDYERATGEHVHKGTFVPAKTAGCTTAGNKAYYVCKCGKWFSDSGCTVQVTAQDVTIAAKGHTEVIDAAKAATCTETGLSEGSHCAVCGHVIREQTVMAALGHDFSGKYLFDETDHWKQCTRCKEVEPKENHIFDNDADTTCNKCDYERTAGQHTHSGTFVPAKAPDCTTTGNKAYYVCTCGKWFSDSGCTTEVTAQDVTIAAKGHTEVIDAAKAATCTEPGLSEGSHCAVCGHVIKEQTVTAALGHDFSGKYKYDSKGHWKECSRCEAVDTKHKHRYDNSKDTTCNDCDYKRKIKKPSSGNNNDSEEKQPTPPPAQKPEPSSAPNPPTPAPPQLPPSAVNPAPPVQEPQPKDTPNPPKQENSAEVESSVTPPQEPQTEQAPQEQETQQLTQGLSEDILTDAIGQGTVIVTLNNVDETVCTAKVADTAAVARAVLSKEELAQTKQGEVIEIRIDVERPERVPEEDAQVIENGIADCQKELPDLVMGMYVDISMFMRIGSGDWRSIHATKEPVKIVIDIPQELVTLAADFYIMRAHEGEYLLLKDLDETQETITIQTEAFSTYAILYQEQEHAAQPKESKTEHKCGLCHICPTFLGICYFIWLAIIVAVILTMWLILRRKRRKEEEREI